MEYFSYIRIIMLLFIALQRLPDKTSERRLDLARGDNYFWNNKLLKTLLASYISAQPMKAWHQS